MADSWQQKIEAYCEKYDIPILFLAETLYEPKVIPMIRGKAFEYSVINILDKVLPSNEWRVSKSTPTEELAYHDTDIRIFHKRTGKVLRVECKLAKKEGHRFYKDGHSEIRVKCMRSRTLGDAKVRELAPKLGIQEQVLKVHNDQYLPADFDIIITSIGNAFYRTDHATGLYEWKPTKIEKQFLEKLGAPSEACIKDFAYNRVYVARTVDLAAKPNTGVICSRRKCNNKSGCGFIPNYPIIRFDAITNKPTNGWIPIEESASFFKTFVTSP